MSSISLVWAAETQKRALDSMMGVAGKPTTTVPMFLLSISRPNALKGNADVRHKAQRTTLPRLDLSKQPDTSLHTRGEDHTPDFGGHVEHQGNDGGVVVAVNDEAHFAEFPAEVGGVL